MATLLNLNPRGIRISPAYKQDTYHYYLCVLDVSTNTPIDYAKFKLEEVKSGDTVIQFKYDGTLTNPGDSDPITTIMLPLVVSQKLAQPNTAGDNLSFSVTDSHGNTCSGNPNKGRPPVVPAVDRSQSLVSTVLIFQSETVSSAYFVGAILNTAYNIAGESAEGGYSNAVLLGTNGSVITGALQVKDGKNPVAACGVIGTSYHECDTMRIQAGTVVSSDLSFTYDNPHSF